MIYLNHRNENKLKKEVEKMEYRNYENAELVEMFAGLDYYDPDMNSEICDRAGLSEEYKSSDGETFESVIYRAIEILKELGVTTKESEGSG